MAFGSNLTEVPLFGGYKRDPELGKMGSELRKREYNQRVSEALKGVNTPEGIDGKIAALKEERAQLQAFLEGKDSATGNELKPQANESGIRAKTTQSEYKVPVEEETDVAGALKTAGKYAAMGVAAPFVGAGLLIKKLYDKIMSGEATEEEVAEYKAKMEGYSTDKPNNMQGYKPALADYSLPDNSAPAKTKEAPLFTDPSMFSRKQPSLARIRQTGRV